MGRLIIIEGTDGSGKSSLADSLYKEINKREPDSCLLVREPGGTEIGKSLRNILIYDKDLSNLGRFYGFLMDRAHLYESLVIPQLEKGKTIISDRSFVSSYIYQVVNGLVDYDLFIQNNREILKGCKGHKCSLLLLKVDKENQVKRLNKRSDSPIFEGTEWLDKSREQYDNLDFEKLLSDLDFKCDNRTLSSSNLTIEALHNESRIII